MTALTIAVLRRALTLLDDGAYLTVAMAVCAAYALVAPCGGHLGTILAALPAGSSAACGAAGRELLASLLAGVAS